MKSYTAVPIALAGILFAGCNSGRSIEPADTGRESSATKSAADWQQKLDPQMKAVLDALAGLHGKPIESLTPEEARKQPSPADAAKVVMQKKGMDASPEAVGKVEDKKIGNNVARVYWPKEGKQPYPIVLYFHGGGWVIADLDTYDATPRAIANLTGAIVVSAEYRHAPENKFPAAVEDAYAAYKWVLGNARSLKGDASRVAVMGESAGGNLATEVALMARDKKERMPVYQVLVYPVTQYGDFSNESYTQFADAKPLNKAMMQWFWSRYLPSPSDGDKAAASPVKAEVSGLPPATVIGAEIDPLQTEGRQYADQLSAAGVKVNYKLYEGVTHEFFGMGKVVDKAKDAESKAAADLRAAFAK